MLFKVSTFIFFTLFFLGLIYKNKRLSPPIFLLFGCTSLIMSLFKTSSLTTIYMMRYFLYIISALLAFIVPLILIIFVLLVFQSLWWKKQKEHALVTAYNTFASILLILFFFYSLWILVTIKDVQLQVIASLYSSIAIYFAALYLSYLFLTNLVKWIKYNSKAKTIVILGTDIDDEGEFRSDLRKRMNRALNYYKKGSERLTFIVSGGNPTDKGITESEAMRRFLLANQIDDSQIIKESMARNTKENIANVKAIIDQEDLGQVILVTNTYHLFRTLYYCFYYDLKTAFLGVRTALIGLPYASTREFLALLLLTKELNLFFIIYIMLSELIKNL